MSTALQRSEARVRYAQLTLDLHRHLADEVRSDDALHRSAMARVFLCEDRLFFLIRCHEVFARAAETSIP